MNNMNTGIRNGRICNDIEVRMIANGSKVAKFTLAVNNKYKNSAGEWVKTTAFLSCEAWGKTADTIESWFAKGDPITIRESIKQDEWEDKTTGKKQTKLIFRVEEFWFEEGYDYSNHCWSERKSKGEKTEKQSKNNKEDDTPPAGDDDHVPF